MTCAYPTCPTPIVTIQADGPPPSAQAMPVTGSSLPLVLLIAALFVLIAGSLAVLFKKVDARLHPYRDGERGPA